MLAPARESSGGWSATPKGGKNEFEVLTSFTNLLYSKRYLRLQHAQAKAGLEEA